MEKQVEIGTSPSAVAALVISPKGIPLIRDPKKPAPHYWKLPGGRSGPDESPETSAIREVEEEIGLILKKDELKIVYREERESHAFYLFRDEVFSLEGLKSKGDEGEEVKLFLPEELKNLPDLFPPHREILEEIKFIPHTYT